MDTFLLTICEHYFRQIRGGSRARRRRRRRRGRRNVNRREKRER